MGEADSLDQVSCRTAGGQMRGPLFRTYHLSVVFGGLVALAELDLEIHKGEIIGLIGPNGAGKTSAFNVMTGLARPANGKVYFKDIDITGVVRV